MDMSYHKSIDRHISVMIGWLEFDITVVWRWRSIDPYESHLMDYCLNRFKRLKFDLVELNKYDI